MIITQNTEHREYRRQHGHLAFIPYRRCRGGDLQRHRLYCANGHIYRVIVNYNGVLYKSKIDNNVWAPDVYPAGWEVYEG